MPLIPYTRLRLSALSLAIACALPTVTFAQTNSTTSSLSTTAASPAKKDKTSDETMTVAATDNSHQRQQDHYS